MANLLDRLFALNLGRCPGKSSDLARYKTEDVLIEICTASKLASIFCKALGKWVILIVCDIDIVTRWHRTPDMKRK